MTCVQPSFWKSIDNHNCSTKQKIERLKELINKKSEMSQLIHSDLRLHAHCSFV